MIFLFSTAECKIGGTCQTWLPQLRARYGEDLVEVIAQPEGDDWIGVDNHNACFHAHVVLSMRDYDMKRPPLPFVMDGWRIGEPCGRCGGEGQLYTGTAGVVLPGCPDCDSGIVWRGEA